jgi:hypothetical protein
VIAAAVGGLILVLSLSDARAQSAPPGPPIAGAFAHGSISGVVQDESGTPVPGAMISALGVRTSVAVTDGSGRFELRMLAPGPYLLRAHVSGFAGSRGQVVEVRASARATCSIAVRRASAAPSLHSASPPVLAAGVGVSQPLDVVTDQRDGETTAQRDGEATPAPAESDSEQATADDHGETAWRLRHLRRGILKEITVAEALGPESGDGSWEAGFPSPLTFRSAEPSGEFVSAFLAGMPLTGQLNLLTMGSFDSPRQLFAGNSFSHSITHVSLAAPIGETADWSVRGALTQGDISSWFVAGAYATRVPARHRYDLGLSYTTQRYDGGNPAALREVSDGSRNVGAVYGFDTFAVSPAVALTYGARFSRYDYLSTSGLFSPRVEVTYSPGRDMRLQALASSRALAPGAEEFLPPLQTGVWVPPQRTFSSIVEGQPLAPQRTEHVAVRAERDFGVTTVSVRAFHQRVDDQLVTVFGFESPTAPNAQLGHYLVGSAGDVEAMGWGAGVRATLLSRVNGSVEYSVTRSRWSRSPESDYVLLIAPAVVRPDLDRVHDVATTVETNVPETATRILVVARLSSLSPSLGGERGGADPRFDVQLHQSLPFMDFSAARWEMLVAVRNAFHEASVDSSVYDELLVVSPPKRIVGGLTLRF